MFTIRNEQFAVLRKKALGDELIKTFATSRQSGAWDDQGDAVLVKDARGNTSRVTFDPHGFVGGVVSPLGRTWKLENTDDGKLLGLTNPAGLRLGLQYTPTGEVANVAHGPRKLFDFAYDPAGNLTRVGYPDRTTTLLEHRSADQLARLTDRRGVLQSYEYDAAGLLVAVVDGNGNRTTFEYGGWDRPDRAHFADGSIESYGYNPVGLVHKIARDAETLAEITYNDAGRPVLIHFGDGETLTFAYDDKGNVIEATNAELTVKFEYDDQGRVLAEDQGGQVIKYRYDKAGLLIGLTYPSGEEVEFTYDADLRLASVKDWTAGLYRFSYALDDQRTEQRWPSGLLTTIERSPAGLPTTIVTADPQAYVSEFRSQYRERFAFRLLYDDEDRVKTFRDSEYGACDYGYDPENQLLRVQAERAERNERFAYDGAGNRTQCNGETATFNVLNQLTSQGGMQAAYDQRGNLVRLGGWRFTYNGRNLLIKAESWDGPAVTFRYDAFGRRIGKRTGDRELRYVWAGEQLVSEQEGKANACDYLYYPGTYTPLAMRRDGQVYAYHTDHLGTPRRLTDLHGKTVWAADYRAFGEAQLHVNTVANPLRFPGQYQDDETGLHYNRFRYYSPRLGRYLSRDPVTFLGGLHFYAYAANDPINGADPLGLWPSWKSIVSVVAAVAVGIAVVALAPVALPLAIVAAGAAAGAVGAGLNEALNQEKFCLSCIAKASLKGAFVGTVAALPFAFLPATAGVAAYMGTGAVSGALSYGAEVFANPGMPWSWSDFGKSVALGTATAGAGRYLGGKYAQWRQSQTPPARVSPQMEQKILYGERVPNANSPNGMSNRVIGGHSPEIKNNPNYAHEVVSNNPDGTTSAKFVTQHPDGNLSNMKSSTLAPDSWSDAKIIDTTKTVGNKPPVGVDPNNGNTLHQGKVDGVQWEVIKTPAGDVTSSYPTGGGTNPPSNFQPLPPPSGPANAAGGPASAGATSTSNAANQSGDK